MKDKKFHFFKIKNISQFIIGKWDKFYWNW